MGDTTRNANSSTSAGDGEHRLGPVSYVVLGFVEHNGSMTSYELKHKVESSVGYIWPFPHTQLYTEPRRLAQLGLLQEESEAGGRRRRTYSITDAGRRALRGWLDAPARVQTEIRDLGLLQLFFGATTDASPAQIKARARALARAQLEAHEQRLTEYLAIEAAIHSGELGDMMLDGGCSHRTLSVGMGMERLMIDFWRGIEAHPPDHC